MPTKEQIIRGEIKSLKEYFENVLEKEDYLEIEEALANCFQAGKQEALKEVEKFFHKVINKRYKNKKAMRMQISYPKWLRLKQRIKEKNGG